MHERASVAGRNRDCGGDSVDREPASGKRSCGTDDRNPRSPTATTLEAATPAIATIKATPARPSVVPEPVETSNPEGVDYGWVMQVTFVTTIVVGAPIVALLSTQARLPTWGSRVEFAIRVGAVIWILTAIAVLAYAKRTQE